MTAADYDRKLDELDRLLNDPFVPMRADRIWDLLADMQRGAASGQTAGSSNVPALCA